MDVVNEDALVPLVEQFAGIALQVATAVIDSCLSNCGQYVTMAEQLAAGGQYLACGGGAGLPTCDSVLNTLVTLVLSDANVLIAMATDPGTTGTLITAANSLADAAILLATQLAAAAVVIAGVVVQLASDLLVPIVNAVVAQATAIASNPAAQAQPVLALVNLAVATAQQVVAGLQPTVDQATMTALATLDGAIATVQGQVAYLAGQVPGSGALGDSAVVPSEWTPPSNTPVKPPTQVEAAEYLSDLSVDAPVDDSWNPTNPLASVGSLTGSTPSSSTGDGSEQWRIIYPYTAKRAVYRPTSDAYYSADYSVPIRKGDSTWGFVHLQGRMQRDPGFENHLYDTLASGDLYPDSVDSTKWRKCYVIGGKSYQFLVVVNYKYGTYLAPNESNPRYIKGIITAYWEGKNPPGHPD